MLVLLQGMVEEDRGFVMQQSIGNMTTTEQRYSHLNTAIAIIHVRLDGPHLFELIIDLLIY